MLFSVQILKCKDFKYGPHSSIVKTLSKNSRSMYLYACFKIVEIDVL